MPATIEKALLTPEEAAAHIGCEPQTLAVWRSTGRYRLPFVRVGRLIRYRRADLDRWLESRLVVRRLTKRQEATNERSSGMNQVFYVNQLIDLIEAKMLDMEDEKLLLRLRRLNELLESMLVA